MFTKFGILSILAGVFIGIFSTISGFMQADNIWVGLTLSKLNEDMAERIVDAVSVEFIQNALYTLFYDLPLAGVVVGLGVVF